MYRPPFLALAILIIVSSSAGCNAPGGQSLFQKVMAAPSELGQFSGQVAQIPGQFLCQLCRPGVLESRPKRVVDTPNKEQLASLQEIGVYVTPRDSITPQMGLGAGAFQFAGPIRTFLMRVEEIARTRFDWYLTPHLPDIAMAHPGGVILLNPGVMGRVSLNAQYLMALHECSHHLLGHTAGIGTTVRMTQPWLLPSMELDADRNAARLLRAAGWSAQQIIYGAIELYDQRPKSTTHPSGVTRIMAMREALRGM